MIHRNCKKLKQKPLCWAPENSWNVLFLLKSVVSLCLPLTWQVFGSATPRLMLRSFFSMQIFFPPHPDHTALSWLSSFSSCSLVLCHRSWLWLSWSFAKLKMGQLPFLNDTSLSLCIWITSPAWEQRGGGQLWRNDLVWIKTVSQQAPQGLILSPACLRESLPHYWDHIMLHQLLPPLVFLFLAVKFSETQ